MDFLINVVLTVLAFLVSILLLVLICYFVWVSAREALKKLVRDVLDRLHRSFELIRKILSPEALSDFFRALVRSTGCGLQALALQLCSFLADLGHKSYSSLVKGVRRLVADIFRAVVVSRRPGFKRRVKPLFRVDAIRAEKAVEQRRNFLARALREATRAKSREILEIPPGFDKQFVSSEPLSALDDLAQSVRLSLQEASDQYLLFGRVLDALVAVLRRAGELSLSPDQRFVKGGTLDVSLRLLEPKEAPPEIFPWVVVVGTDQPELMRESLLTIKEWLGIGIDIAAPLRFKKYESCRHSPDTVGVSAGILRHRADGAAYALTCDHVVPRCDCYVAHGDPTTGLQPDAALLPLGEGCFSLDPSRLAIRRAATQREIEDFSKTRKNRKVKRLGGRRRAYSGLVENPMTTYSCDEVICKFPTFSVVLEKKSFLFRLIPWPLFRKTFSEPGDSGAWVLSQEDDSWLGMVVGGAERSLLTYVSYGQALVSFFQEALTRVKPGGSSEELIPYS